MTNTGKNVLIILAHPDIESSIANRIVVDGVKNLENVRVRNLSELYSDFIIDIKTEQEELIKADLIIFQFPFYWYSIPSILKQWIDKVLEYGFAYGSTGDKLKGKDFLLSITI
jgi:putative NADPH-quinone reductase